MEYYKNNSEFLEEVILVSKELLQCYIKRVAIVSDKKELYTLKGRVIWQRDILSLSDSIFTKEEIEEYDNVQAEIRKKIKSIIDKCRLSAENKVIIPLVYLINRMKCSEFEIMILFQLISAEFDSELANSYSVIMNDANVFTPSLEMCGCIYTLDSKKQRELLLMEYTRIRLLEMFLEDDISKNKLKTYSAVPLRLSRRIIDFSINMNSENKYTGADISMIWPWTAKDETAYIAGDISDKMIKYAVSDKEKKIFCIIGEEGAGKHFQLRQFSKKSGINILLVDANTLFNEKNNLEEQIKGIKLECVIRNAVVAFENVNLEQKNEFCSNLNNVMENFFELGNLVFMLMENIPYSYHNNKLKEHFVVVDLNNVSREDRMIIWKQALEKKEEFKDISIEGLAVKFEFTPGKIINSVKSARRNMIWEGKSSIDEKELTESCYKQLSHKLSDKAVKLNAKYTWEDLVMPAGQMELLKAACNQVKYKHKVYDKWGFSEKNHYGQGVSMMFYGPPGTGKTMTAQVIANELNMEIYKVDLSTVMSKYIGETEKNLSVIFDEVKKSNSILFFDEADSLFGKRTETKDSNDKYANAETSYLLQKMEEYSGIVILATNYMQNFDEAYKRRIKYMIHFSFPEADERKRLWESCFGKMSPREYIDFEFLANHFEMSGSHIKNVVLSAAFLAASKNKSIGMEEIIIALKQENEKYGKILTKADVGEYYYLL